MKKLKKKETSQGLDPLLRNIMLFTAALIIADLITILYFQNQAAKYRQAPIKQNISDIVAEEYTNPETGKLKSLKVGGEFAGKMPVFKDKLNFKLTYDPILAGPNNLHVLSICCPSGYSKDFYTAKMPWAFILYEFEPGLPTVTIFDIDGKTNKGTFVIVILDKLADESAIRAVSVAVFEELLKQYLPGYVWSGSVRKELM
jgi:hypothetical protein